MKTIVVLGHNMSHPDSEQIMLSRLEECIRLSDKNTKIILTGGDVAICGITEAEYMYDKIKNIIVSNKITLETNATRTVENIIFSIPLINYNSTQTIWITSRFHSLRVAEILKVLGHNSDIVCWIDDRFIKDLEDLQKHETKQIKLITTEINSTVVSTI